MNIAETTKLLGNIVDAFPGRVVATESMLRLWTAMLEDLPASEAMRALRAYLAEGPPHPPCISDIRRRVAEARVDAIDAGAAWGEVQRAIRNYGYNRSPPWSHPAVAHAVDALGWRTICHTLETDLPTLRAQFERYLKGYLDGQRREANSGALEAHVERRGQLAGADLVAGLLGKGGAK
jgi:hypothetical protein